jgi:hypothetical protein
VGGKERAAGTEDEGGRKFKKKWNTVVANDRNTKGEVTQMNRTSFSVGLTRTGRRCTKYESKKGLKDQNLRKTNKDKVM